LSGGGRETEGGHAAEPEMEGGGRYVLRAGRRRPGGRALLESLRGNCRLEGQGEGYWRRRKSKRRKRLW